jgi:hypothetical protein
MKDPAVLFYINDWLTSTSEMDADCRGWYLNLILHNYDKGDLPNDIEKLAVLSGVKFSEFERFKQVFEHVLRQKFELKIDGRLCNSKTKTVLKSRELFKEKRSDAGKKSYLMKYFYANFPKEAKNKKMLKFVIENINLAIDTKNQTEIEHMFKHLFELYINENEIENKDININVDENNLIQKPKLEIEKTDFQKAWDEFLKMRIKAKKAPTEHAIVLLQKELRKLSEGDELKATKIINQSIIKGWASFYELKENNIPQTKQEDQKAKMNNAFNELANKYLNEL